MKKISIAILFLIGVTSNAEYSVKIPLEFGNGYSGSLPEGSINIIGGTPPPPPVSNWVTTTPTYSSWVASGSIYGCNNWLPLDRTVNYGVAFTQTATDCEQDQTRSRQEREYDDVTASFRNSGSPIVENNVLTVSDTRGSTGILTCQYAENSYEWIERPSVPEWELFYNDVYAGSSSEYGGYNEKEISYSGYTIFQGPLVSSRGGVSSYEVCSF